MALSESFKVIILVYTFEIESLVNIIFEPKKIGLNHVCSFGFCLSYLFVIA
jgi:hypothetical protein